MTLEIPIAAFLTGALICKVYRRRHPLPPRKDSVTYWEIPPEHQKKVCELWDTLNNKTGCARKEQFEMWQYITTLMPKELTGSVVLEFNGHKPKVKITTKP